MIKNKCGYELLEYIKCEEHEINDYENITGAGVVFRVGNPNKYLIGFNNWRKQWEIPAGRIEKGESARETAIRELFEETHQKVNDLAFNGLFKKRRPNGEIVYMAIFTCESKGITPFVKLENDEFDKIKLWDLKENIDYIDEIDLEIINTVKKNV